MGDGGIILPIICKGEFLGRFQIWDIYRAVGLAGAMNLMTKTVIRLLLIVEKVR